MINETKFTEGEWFTQITEVCKGIIALEVITSTFDICAYRLGIRNKYDAYLIAAAPEMYRMIERLKLECEMYNSEFGDPSSGEFEAVFTEVEDLLAKARGKL